MNNDSTLGNRIAVHFKGGKVIHGHTNDFSAQKDQFHLIVAEDDGSKTTRTIECAALKAVFFVKSKEGNKEYRERKHFDEVEDRILKGMKIKVEFDDGEVIRGVSLGYNKTRKGFFIVPVDDRSNNERIYIITDATQNVVVGEAAVL
jgi:hypothetical protein